MKKLLLFINMLLVGLVGNSQVLFTENFENYTLGNVFTSVTNNTIPGQGGWYLPAVYNDTTRINAYQITQDLNKGKVLTLTSFNLPTKIIIPSIIVRKPGIDAFINQRTPGNNVIKVEVDYYTGEEQINKGVGVIRQVISLIYGNYGGQTLSKNSVRINYQSDSGRLDIAYNVGNDSFYHMRFNNTSSGIINIPYKTWVKIIVYLDYNNRKIYSEIPYANSVGMGDQFLENSTSANVFEEFKPTEIGMVFNAANEGSNIPLTNKYDNIKITALNAVPQDIILSAATFLNDKFTIYPNPASNLVTITNTDNMPVQEVTIYDMAGKQLSTQTFNTEAEVQLNVENLANGTYMLHIQTTEGTAVKQLVKK